MRSVLSSVAVVLGLVSLNVGLGAAASAAPTPTPGGPEAAQPAAKPGKKLCVVDDKRLTELSGMVATKNGYVVINDGSEGDEAASREKVFFLDRDCEVVEEVSYSGGGPRDTEDLVLSPDGRTLWIADIGDNSINKERRTTVALWTMPVDGSAKPVIHRLRYPDGPHDAEALLFNGDGTPVIVTKAVGGTKLYGPVAALVPNSADGVAMKELGEVKLPKTTTAHALGAAARMLVTGGATAPGGGRVVLRTYTDAFEWDVPDGNVVTALAGAVEPRHTVLPDEPIGEAITYTPDGGKFLTVSETAGLDVKPTILSYVPNTQAAPKVKTVDNEQDDGKSWFDSLDLDDITYLIGAVGVLGALLVGAGVVGIFMARHRSSEAVGASKANGRQPVPAASGTRGYGGDGPAAGYGSAAGRRGREPARGRSSGGTYGGGRSGAVYGGGQSGGSGKGGVYGGAGGGSVYGGSADDHAGSGYSRRGYDSARPDDGYR